MLVKKCKDFDEMFYKLNRMFLLHPEIVNSMLGGHSGYTEDIIIECKSYNCSIDISRVGYNKNKWGKLLGAYIEYNELLDFYARLNKHSGLSCVFNFKYKKKNNGSCLVSIVLTRKYFYNKWSAAKVFYRTMEVNRAMAADLVLLNKFFDELPKDLCDIQNVVFFISQCYFDYIHTGAYLDLFNININQLDTSKKPIQRLIFGCNEFFSKDSKISNYYKVRVFQEIALGLTKFKNVDINKLSIKNFFEKEKKVK